MALAGRRVRFEILHTGRALIKSALARLFLLPHRPAAPPLPGTLSKDLALLARVSINLGANEMAGVHYEKKTCAV